MHEVVFYFALSLMRQAQEMNILGATYLTNTDPWPPYVWTYTSYIAYIDRNDA